MDDYAGAGGSGEDRQTIPSHEYAVEWMIVVWREFRDRNRGRATAIEFKVRGRLMRIRIWQTWGGDSGPRCTAVAQALGSRAQSCEELMEDFEAGRLRCPARISCSFDGRFWNLDDVASFDSLPPGAIGPSVQWSPPAPPSVTPAPAPPAAQQTPAPSDYPPMPEEEYR